MKSPPFLPKALFRGGQLKKPPCITKQTATHRSARCMILGGDGIATADVISNIEPKVEK